MVTRSVISFLAIALLTGSLYAQKPTSVSSADVPIPVGHTTDPDLKDLTWNRWETPNFVVLSLDARQGQYLVSNVEKIKTWTFTRWGLPDISFPKRSHKKDTTLEPGCMLVCVPDKAHLKKLFKLDQSQAEVRSESGKIKRSVCWISLENKPSEVVPTAITVLCLKEFEEKYKVKFGPWMYRGMAFLNGTLSQIRGHLNPLRTMVQNNSQMFFSKSIFEMTEDKYSKLGASEQHLYDMQAAAMVLLLRKEFGQANFVSFARGGASEQEVRRTFGFNNYGELDSTFKRYMYHLSNDIATNRTPDSYLNVTPPQRQSRKP